MRKAVFALFMLAGCASAPAAPQADWTTWRASGPYSLRIPAGMVQVPVTPIDSAVDQLRSDGLRLGLDYGRYGCGAAPPQPGERHSLTTARIDGRTAQIDRYTTTLNEIGEFAERLRAQIPHDAAGNCLAIHAQCRTAADCDTARAIIETVDLDPPG